MDPTQSAKVTAASPGETDIVGLYRLAAGVVGFCALAGMVGAIGERSLGRRRRLAALVAASLAATASARGARDGRLAARLVHERPKAATIGGLTPLVVSPLMGGARNPLWMLAIVGTSLSATVVGGSRGQRYAVWAAIYWTVQGGAVTGWSEVAESEKTRVTFVVIPLALLAGAVTGRSVLEVAHRSRGLARALERTEQDLSSLDGARDEMAAALRPLGEALQALREDVRALQEDDEQRPEALQDVDRASARLAERSAILDELRERPRSVQEVVRRRVREGESLTQLPVSVMTKQFTDPSLERAALLLLATFVTGTLANAGRYARDASEIMITIATTEDGIEVFVADDAPSRATVVEHGAGLMTLRDRARQLGGDLKTEPSPNGFVVRLVLPRREAAAGRQTMTDELFSMADRPLQWSIRLCGAMVLAMSTGDETLVGEHRRLWGVLNSAVAVGYEALEQAGLPSYRPLLDQRRYHRGAVTALLGLAALVTSGGAHGEHTVLSGWVGAAIARHALVADTRVTRALTALNVLSIFPGFRGPVPAFVKMLGHQAGVIAMGPIVVAERVRAEAVPLQAREWALEDAWSDGEQLHRLALAFETRHGWKDPAERAMRVVGDRPSTRRLAALIKESQDAGTRLADASGGYLGLAEEMAKTLAEQIWPASVAYSVNGDTFRTFPTEAIMAVAFRRDALAIARAVGEAVFESRPPDRLGRRGTEDVELNLRLDGFASDGAVDCSITATPRIEGTPRERLRGAIEDHDGDMIEDQDAVRIVLFPGAYKI
ncbi:MAG: hypothetical protein MSC31_17595 [Solirubrobacteraceae bacterium MAG38_C4-C5]|nr:hypothetical protein [Candidatus Siliceabacter maunaloa]